MLRLWRDLYRIVLQPDQISLVTVRQGRFSKSEARSTAVSIPQGATSSWQDVLAHLDGVIAEIKSDRADVEIVLSNHFVRYAVVPWSNDVMDAAEELVMARIGFEDVYGDRAADWDVRLSEAAYGQARLASAVDRELIPALHAAFAGTSLRLASVQPYLMTAFNHCQRQMTDDCYLFMLGEPGRLCLAQIKDRQWSQVRMFAVGDLAHEMSALLHREILRSGLDKATRKYLLDSSLDRESFSHPDITLLSYQ